MNEAAIRDLLAADLSVLEEGMELVKIEQYIPKSLGTRNFLDILAKDKAGQWVIIEVKKTNAAARQAAHEASSMSMPSKGTSVSARMKFGRSWPQSNGRNC